jgi:hypothetical protein
MAEQAMTEQGQRLGQLLLDSDVITKRQLAKAIQKQVAGDKRKIGEILIELGFCTIEDLTDAMLDTHHEEKEKVVEEKKVATEISEEKVLGTKFTLSVHRLDEYEEKIEELERLVADLRVEVAKKRNK